MVALDIRFNLFTGWKPAGRAEAAVMRDILTEHGVPEDRLILEDQAQTTKESFRNIAGIVSVEE